jgi:hypothetical protein
VAARDGKWPESGRTGQKVAARDGKWADRDGKWARTGRKVLSDPCDYFPSRAALSAHLSLRLTRAIILSKLPRRAIPY